MPGDRPLTAEEVARLDAVAATVHRRGLQTPAAVALAAHRPLGGLAANAVHVLTPILSPVVDPQQLEELAKLLQHPAALDHLLVALEDGPPAETRE